MNAWRRISWCSFALVILCSHRAEAQAAPILSISPDVRGEGAGRSLAFLGTGPYAPWGNVGGVAYASGFTAATMRTHLVPDLATGVILDYSTVSYGLKLGNRRAGLNLNHTHLSYGEGAFDEDNERAFGLSGGIEIAPGIGIGIGIKSLKLEYAASGSRVKDKVAPVFDFGLLGEFPVASAPMTAAVLTGVSIHNLGPDVKLGDNVLPLPLPRTLRLASGLDLRSRNAATIGYDAPFGDAPIVSLTPAIAVEKDLFDSSSPGDPETTESFWEKNDVRLYTGVDVRLLDFFSFRYGYIYDDPGEIKGKTWGYGVNLLSCGGIDFASIPQFRELARVTKWSVWLRVPAF